MVSFRLFVEKELGKFPHFLIYAVLEWALIILLFVDGFLAFLANQFAKFFDLKVPCLLCTRIDHILVRRNPDFYYNDSICDAHKKNVSTLAFCHVHKKLSDIKKMCERCLVSFATEKESGCDTYKSLVGILHKDIEMFVDEDQDSPSAASKKDDSPSGQRVEKTSDHLCCCCGEPLKVKSYSRTKSVSFLPASGPTPRTPFPSFKHRQTSRNLSLDLSQLKAVELKLVENDEEDDRPNLVRQDSKAVRGPLLTDHEEEGKTPSAIRGNNRFFGIPLTDSPSGTPRLQSRLSRKSMLERTESGVGMVSNIDGGDSMLHHLKRQVRLDRKSLIALYMELDEERSASAVAANNAMAMITRLQAEKAAVRMEALQYQRMMEEQAEYDQEALQAMHEVLVKREEEIRELEVDLEAYREKYGCLEEFEVHADNSAEGFRVVRPATNSSSRHGSPEYGSPMAPSTVEEEEPPKVSTGKAEEKGGRPAISLHDHNGGSSSSEAAAQKMQQQMERSRFLGRLRNLDKKLEIADDRDSSSDND